MFNERRYSNYIVLTLVVFGILFISGCTKTTETQQTTTSIQEQETQLKSFSNCIGYKDSSELFPDMSGYTTLKFETYTENGLQYAPMPSGEEVSFNVVYDKVKTFKDENTGKIFQIAIIKLRYQGDYNIYEEFMKAEASNEGEYSTFREAEVYEVDILDQLNEDQKEGTYATERLFYLPDKTMSIQFSFNGLFTISEATDLIQDYLSMIC